MIQYTLCIYELRCEKKSKKPSRQSGMTFPNTTARQNTSRNRTKTHLKINGMPSIGQMTPDNNSVG